MATEVSWLPAALDDLDAIAAYISADSPAYASAVVENILATSRSMTEFPMLGRAVPEWEDEQVREHIVYHYRLIYRVRANQIIILAVVHGARQLYDQWRERSE